jgi:hypothetical protein
MAGPRKPNIPSQRFPRTKPYDNSRQPDVEQFKGMRRPYPNEPPPRGSFVQSVYDARPVQAVDFFREFETTSGLNETVEEFTLDPIPPGRTFVMREFGFAMQAVPFDNGGEGGASSPDSLVNEFGFPSDSYRSNPLRFGVLLDGNPDQFYGDREVNDIVLNTKIVPCYIIAQSGVEITFRFTFSVTGAQNVPFTIFGYAFGNMLIASGRDHVQDPANSEPIPVKTQIRQVKGAPE